MSAFGRGDRVRLRAARPGDSKTGTVELVALGYHHGHPTRYAVRWDGGTTTPGYRAQELERVR